ncbi:hypothetical protein BDV34DRAFT_225519 [Aspergillus parasiticus]|uniref:Uncharacterized protein n=1 Tax=Aspergillus parasiticus TaxID=5067 RepID=A0A5N6DJS2_ASPPA|nr:hypothetical protein BDV34DRAFT_225519 [Aspergillus parasiticus]
MWFRHITAQRAFVLASLFLTSKASAAAIPSSLVDSISTTGADGKPTSVPIIDVPTCLFCREDNEDGETTGGCAPPGVGGYKTDQPILASDSLKSFPVLTVSSDGDASYDSSKTARQPPTQVKRAPTATKTDDKYIKLHQTLGKIPEVDQGYAIKISRVTQRPEGNTIILKFDSACYDIQLEHGKKIVFTDRSDATWYSWDKANYEVLGHIKSGLTYVEIERDGREVAAEMNKKGYNLVTNNCRHFVMRLWKKIKA